MKINLATRRLAALLACAALSVAVGCKPLDVRSPIHMANPFTPLSVDKAAEDRREGKEKKDEIEYGVPERMAVIWTDSVYTAPGARPTRGFGGRFFFYDAKGEPIHCEGELTVFGFDDSDTMSQSKVPQKKFVYPSDQLQSHAGMSDLGISYSFWIPWDQADGDRKAISLLPVLKTPDGRVVKSDVTVNVLPGKTPESVHALTSIAQMRDTMNRSAMAQNQNSSPQTSGGYPVGLVGLDQAEHAQSNVRTATIDVPREMGRNLQQPQAIRDAVPRPTYPQSTDLNTQVPSRSVPSVQRNAPNTSLSQRPTAGIPASARPSLLGTPNRSSLSQQPNISQLDVPFPTSNYDPSTGTMTGIGPAPGFQAMPSGRTVAGGSSR